MNLLTGARFKKSSIHNPNDLYKAGKFNASGSPGQVDFLAGQVTLKADLPKGLDKSSLTKLLTKTTKLEGAPGKQNARAASPKDKI